MTVYVCTSGTYSDYSIDAIFTDKEQAEIYCAIHDDGYNYPQVEEWNTDEVKVEPCDSIKRTWIVYIKFDGTVHSCDSKLTIKDCNKIELYGRNRTIKYRVWVTLDKDIPEEKALKIAFDNLAKYKAEQCGI